jgi:hypothetical protein
MGDDAEVLDPCSRAIVEFREEMLLWIDTALVRLRERDQDAIAPMHERSAPATLTRRAVENRSQTHFPARRLVAGLGEAELQPAIRRAGSRNSDEIAGRRLPGGSERPSVVSSGPEPDPRSKSAPIDSSRRLDALARLLDQRLKSSADAASNSIGGRGEVGESNGSAER